MKSKLFRMDWYNHITPEFYKKLFIFIFLAVFILMNILRKSIIYSIVFSLVFTGIILGSVYIRVKLSRAFHPKTEKAVNTRIKLLFFLAFLPLGYYYYVSRNTRVLVILIGTGSAIIYSLFFKKRFKENSPK